MKRIIKVAFIALLSLTPYAAMAVSEGDVIPRDTSCTQVAPYCPTTQADELETALSDLALPELSPPPSAVVAPNVTVSKPITKTVTYDVITRGNITADFAQFKTHANETLNHGFGWSRLGVKFEEVASGGQFTLVLSEAAQVPTFSSGCSAQYSCRAGRYVIINQDRWLSATPAWNSAGGGLRDYQHMVINHETGHWLGHGHTNCSGAGQPAAVMQQQSIDLQGCKFNPWPLDSEIWSTTLGI